MTEDCYIETGREEFDSLIPAVRSYLEKDLLELNIDGNHIRGYRSPDTPSIWIRDYSDMLRGIRYFEKDLKSTVEHFAETQAANGRIFDYFTTSPEKLPCERENWTKYVRVPVEADVEYRFIKAAFLAWQAHGDDSWIEGLMPNMKRAMHYALSHPHRFDKDTKLVKRPYTIDTWDFAYTAGKHNWLQFQIDDNTYWGIFHGDNSGYYEAAKILEFLHEYSGRHAEADYYSRVAGELKENCSRLCWNGSFFTHFVKLNDCIIPGVDEAAQLSMSNPMAVNRGMASLEQAQAIVKEYLKRRKQEGSFAEWYSINPPFPDGVFGDDKLKGGAYINGGIFPLAGGELAKAAFTSGYETYGVDILDRYYQLIKRHGGSWLWYFPDGTPSTAEASTSPEATPTDGWGSTAMLDALVAGLAGIEDRSKLFRKVRLSPRWPAANIDNARVRISYPSSGAWLEYDYLHKPGLISLEVRSMDSDTDFRLMLPGRPSAGKVLSNGIHTDYFIEENGESLYVNFHSYVSGNSKFEVHYDR